MVNSYLLDTSVIINFLIRKKEEDIKIINTIDGNLTSSNICLAELYEGIYRTKNKNLEEEIILKFFANLTTVFGLDHETAKKFGQIRTQLKTDGKIIEDMDILIAATCLANDQILITHNYKHFTHIPNLEIFQSQ